MNADELRDFAKRYTAAWGSQNPASVAAESKGHFDEADSQRQLKVGGSRPLAGKVALVAGGTRGAGRVHRGRVGRRRRDGLCHRTHHPDAAIRVRPPGNHRRNGWNGQSLSSGQLAKIYGFTDVDGSQPDAWRYVVEVQEAGRPADATGYR